MPEPTYPAIVVNESEYETKPVRVAIVNKPNSSVDQMEELLKRLLAVLTPAVPTPQSANRSLRYRQDWKQCFERISRNNSRHDNSPDFDRHDEAGLK